jgi:hypothetical protein
MDLGILLGAATFAAPGITDTGGVQAETHTGAVVFVQGWSFLTQWELLGWVKAESSVFVANQADVLVLSSRI